MVDGLALGALPEIAASQRERLRLVALVHHPLALEGGLDEGRRRHLEASERAALAATRRVIATSPATARALAAYDVASARLRVVSPGCDPRRPAKGSGSAVLNLLCVATLTARKGHRLLLEALADLKDRAWRLNLVGGADHEPATAARVRAAIDELGLRERVTLSGAVPPAALPACYDGADLFVLASEHEGYGMALAEALAHGLPIVSTTAGAIPETVPAEAGLLVPLGDKAALRDALASVMDQPALRARLAAGARASRLPSWPEAAARFAAALEGL
ncbi:MAG: glycosyltransferase family 4 protein [Pseudomonadota bacterium]